MEYELTEHAKDVMARRAIRPDWIERALRTPQKSEMDRSDAELEHRLVTLAEFGNRVLRVTVNVQAEPERVITAYFDRGMRGAL